MTARIAIVAFAFLHLATAILGQGNETTATFVENSTTATTSLPDKPDCSTPPIVPNSRVHYRHRKVGAVANYTCYSSYRPVGVPPIRTNVTCRPGGNWTEVKFACVHWEYLENYVLEEEEPFTSNSFVDSVENLQDVPAFPVALLFSEEGNPQNLPVLPDRFCVTLPRIHHGSIVEEGSTSFSTSIGSRLSFMCVPGYYLVGPSFIECLETMEWTEPPVCQPFCQNPPIVPDSVQRVGVSRSGGRFFTSGQVVEYTCNSGFVLVARNSGEKVDGNNTDEGVVLCNKDGSWSDPPMCLQVEMEEPSNIVEPKPSTESCGPPSRTRYGNVTTAHTPSFYLVGETALYTCLEGYRLVGPPVIECMQNLKWTMNPTCVSIAITDNCPPPPPVQDSTHVKANPDTGWIAGETVLYLCQRGYYRVGDPVVQCMPKGYWTSPPKCIPDKTETKTTTTTTTALTTTATEALAEANFKSRRFDCSKPPHVVDGYIVQVTPSEGRYPRGTVVTYRCAPKFTLYGEASITCTDILIWETPPVCKDNTDDQGPVTLQDSGECPANPALPPNTQIIERYMPTGRATVGSFIVLDCMPNFEMLDGAGSPILWCDSNFRWQHQDPPIQCRPRGFVTNVPPTIPTTRQVTSRPPWPWEIITAPPRTTATLWFPPWSPETTTLRFTEEPTTEPLGTHPCPPPPEIANGFMVKITRPNHDVAREMSRKNILYYFGVTVSYVCKAGFRFIGASLIMCQHSGVWSGVPVCFPLPTQPAPVTRPVQTIPITFPFRTTEMLRTSTLASITCSLPPTINNGVVIGRSPTLGPMVPGVRVSYTCMGTYVLVGNSAIRCLRNGNWEMPPVCVPQISTVRQSSTVSTTRSFTFPSTTTTTARRRCGEPPGIPNGEIMYILPLEHAAQKTYYIGTAATYGCIVGFRMIGSPTAYCTSDLNWQGMPVCAPEPTTAAPVECPAPPSVANGFVIINSAPSDGSFNPGSSVQYQCNPGYRMIGFPRIFCTFELKWETPPICAFLSTVSTTTPLATTSTTPVGPATTVATFQTCPAPPLVAFATIVDSPTPPYTMGTIARYACAPGYSLMGPDSVVCLPFSQWSKPPECVPFPTTTSPTTAHAVPQDCPPPPSILHGSSSVGGMTAPSYSPGSAVVYSCNPGYTLVGTPIVLCTVNGVWSTPPACIPRSNVPRSGFGFDMEKARCQEADPVINGYRSAQTMADSSIGWQTGDSFETECFPPYLRLGRRKTVCSEAGTWSAIPTCVRAVSAKSAGNTKIRSKSAKSERRNKYELPPADNQKPMCSLAPAVDHAVAVLRSGAGQSPGSAYLYICEPPYRLVGSPSVLCGSNGKWSAIPTCEWIEDFADTTPVAPIFCGPPPIIEHGNVMTVPATSTVGSVVSYECFPHFQMHGSYTITCLPSGMWSPSPRCTGSTSNNNNHAYINVNSNMMPAAVSGKSAPNHGRGGPMQFSSRFDTSSMLFSAFSTPDCYGGPEWPRKLFPQQLSTKLATRELHIFRELVFNCTGVIVEWRYLSVLPLKSKPVIAYFGVWRLVRTRGLKYQLVAATKVTIVGSVRSEETISLKLHEAEYLNVEPGDVFGLHYEEGAGTQEEGAIPLAYTFSPSPFTQPQLSSTLASLDDQTSLVKRQETVMNERAARGGRQKGHSNIEISVDFDNYGFRFFRLPFVRATVFPF